MSFPFSNFRLGQNWQTQINCNADDPPVDDREFTVVKSLLQNMILKVFLSHQEKGLWQKVKSPLARSQFKRLTPPDKRKEHKKMNCIRNFIICAIQRKIYNCYFS